MRLAALLLTLPLYATTWYVSPSGTVSGNGSQAAPWNLATGLAQTLASGDTLVLEAGAYSGVYATALAGVTIEGLGATLDGSLTLNGVGTTLRDLTVFQSALDRTVPASPGIEVFGPNTFLLHNTVHDVDYDGIEIWSAAANSTAYGNIVYFQGYNASDRGHGHCFYVQSNPGNTLLLENNVCVDGFGWGLHAYTEGGHIDGITYRGNIAFNSGILATVPCSTGGNNNLLTGGLVIAQSPVWDSNYTYYPANGCTSADLGYSAGTNNALLTNNWFVGSTPLIIVSETGLTESGDVEQNPASPTRIRVNGHGSRPVITSKSPLPAGTVGTAYSYQFTASGAAPISWTLASGSLPAGLALSSSGLLSGTPQQSGSFNFQIKAANNSGSQTVTFSLSIGAVVSATCFVRADAYQSGRATVAVYNLFGSAQNAVCDVSSMGLPNGSQVSIVSAENIQGPSIMASVTNQTITIPLSGWTVAAPVGWATPHTALPYFGAFLFR